MNIEPMTMRDHLEDITEDAIHWMLLAGSSPSDTLREYELENGINFNAAHREEFLEAIAQAWEHRHDVKEA